MNINILNKSNIVWATEFVEKVLLNTPEQELSEMGEVIYVTGEVFHDSIFLSKTENQDVADYCVRIWDVYQSDENHECIGYTLYKKEKLTDSESNRKPVNKGNAEVESFLRESDMLDPEKLATPLAGTKWKLARTRQKLDECTDHYKRNEPEIPSPDGFTDDGYS